MTFVAQIKADGSQFQTTVDTLATKLTGLETKSKTVGDTTATAFDKAGGSTAGLGEKLSGVAGAFDKLAQAIRREQDMIEKINGPAQRYEQNLQTLDALLGKNKISTEQYAEQVRKLNAELERTQSIKVTEPTPSDWTAHIKEFSGGAGGRGEGESENMLGKLGGKLGGLGGAGLLMAGGEAFAGIEVAKGLAELQDGYTETGNKLRSLSKDDADFNSLMKQTLAIAQDSRMDWDETASVFQRLDNATRSMGLSEKQVLDLTKELSEASKLSGAGAHEAAMSMIELSHAFSLGTLQGQSFKVLMKDSPVMMHELQMASGMTQEAFERLGLSGKITAQDLVKWFGDASASIQEKFDQTRSTWAEMWIGMKNDSEAAVGWIGDQFASIGHGIRYAFFGAFDDAHDKAVKELAALTKSTRDVMASVKEVDDAIKQERADQLEWNGVIGGTIQNLRSGSSLTQSLGSAVEFLGGKLALMSSVAQRTKDALKDDDDQLKALKDSANLATSEVYELTTAMARIRPMDITTLTGPQQTTYEDARIAQIKAEDALKGYGEATDEVRIAEVKRSIAIQQLSAAVRAGVISTVDYEHALKGLQDPADKAAKAVHNITKYEQEEKRILDDINGARDRFNLGMEVAFDLYARGTISLAQYRQELEKLQAAWNKAEPAPQSVTQQLGFTPQVGAGPSSLPYENGFPAYQDPKKLTEQWRKEMEAFQASAKKTGQALQQLFDPVVNAIDQAFKTGNFDIKALGSSMLDMLEQMILKALEFKAISAIIGVPFGSGGAGGLASLMGFATGGDVTIPHAANGLSGTFAGSGGTDSQLFMARVTPGEHVSIRTPEQMAQAQRQDARPVQVIVQDGGDPRAITAAFASKEFERHVVRVLRKTGRN